MDVPTSLDPVSSIVGALLSLGLPGIVIIALGFAYYRKDKRIEELQDALLELGKENAKAMAEATGAIASLKDVIILRSKQE